ncbi:Hypothetical protein, putative [Bodo saltans]|uniref:Uncharacterized protein n=1 Tax=Bodo saltans TaxID=75058 RepID=A0A0S4IZZ8_BODSA|nr:Hypothetical protein, putative [Bodo saltans]|eukprot:CUG30922.1 Hypothetical protein, putative [Bodo saltans]
MDRGSLIKAVIAASLNRREFALESPQELTATTEKQRAAMIVDAMLLGAPTTSACPTHINNNTPLPSSSLRASPTLPTWRSAANLLSLMKTGAPIRHHHHETSEGAFTVASSALQEIHRALLQEPISKLRWQGALAASVASLQLHAGNDPSGSLRRAYRGAVVEAARDVGGQWTTVLSLLSGKQHQPSLLSGDTPSPSLSSYLTPMLNGASIYKLKALRNGIGKQWRDALQCGIILSNPSSSRQPTPRPVTRVTQQSQPAAAADAQRQDHHQDMLGGLRTSLASTPPPTPSAIAKVLTCLLAEQEAYRSTPSCPRSATVRAFSDDDEKVLTTALQRVALGLQQRHTKRRTKNDENTTFDLAVQQLATHLLVDNSLSSSAATFIVSVVSPSVPPSAARSEVSTVVSSSCWLRDDDVHPLRLFMCDVWLQVAETQRTLPPLNSNRLLVQIVHALTAVDAAHDHDDILDSLYTRWVSCVNNYLQFHSSSRAPGPHSLSYINKIDLLEGLLKCCNRTRASKGVAETLASTCALTPAEFVAMPLACRLPFDTWVSWLAAHVKVLHHWNQRPQSCVAKAPLPPPEDEERVVERILSLLEYLMHAHPAQLMRCPHVADLIGTMPTTTKQFAHRPQQQLRWRGVLDSMAQLLLTLSTNNHSARHRHSSHQPRAVACAVFFQRGAMSADVVHDWKMLNNLFHCAFPPLSLAAEVGGPRFVASSANSREEYCSQKALVNGALHCVLLLAVNKIASHDRAEAGAALLRRTLLGSTTNEQVVGSDSGTASCTMYRPEVALIHSLVALFDRHRHAVVRAVECSSSANDRSGNNGVSRVILTSDDHEFICRASSACDAYLATSMRDHIEGHDDTIPLLVRDVQSKLMIARRMRCEYSSDGTTSRSSSSAWSDVMACAYSFEERGGPLLLGASVANAQRHESLEHRPKLKLILEQDLLSSSFLTLSTSLAAATRSNDHWRRR